MSTTPSTSDLPYTVVGGVGLDLTRRVGVSAVLLNRGGRPVRAETIAPFTACGVDEVIVVLGPQPHYEIEQLAARLPVSRFVLLGREVTFGEQINIGVHESRSPRALVVWSDMDAPVINERTVGRATELGALCVSPLLKNERNETVPSVYAPAFYRALFRTVPTLPGAEGDPTLYPYAGVGLYDKIRFGSLGGFDPQIRNPYWQTLDFGTRAWLWGEQLRVLPSLRLQSTRPLEPDDTTPDAGYARFYLKNLAVRFVRDQGRVPARQLVPFVLRSGLGLAESVRLFRDVKYWVHGNRYRFVQDARRLTELWEVSE